MSQGGKGCGTEGEKLLPSNLKNFENLCQLYFNKAEIVKKIIITTFTEPPHGPGIVSEVRM